MVICTLIGGSDLIQFMLKRLKKRSPISFSTLIPQEMDEQTESWESHQKYFIQYIL